MAPIFSNDNLNGESKSEAELKSQLVYENLGWSFGNNDTSPWKIDEGNGYPYLYWQE
ncbi:MAG: hypothetical protein LBI78_01210 [Campylobacteraceae bacterium]|jgi:hypothetical protein|nr:hypothetical protein [Campylobacteraceae bacterium]